MVEITRAIQAKTQKSLEIAFIAKVLHSCFCNSFSGPSSNTRDSAKGGTSRVEELVVI
jgi:hypothetical protein